MAEREVDLRALMLDRGAETHRPSQQKRAAWFSRYVFPIGILASFAALLMLALGDRLYPALPVTVVPVIVQRGEVQMAGQPMFQAAGWIEPRPTSVSVPALAAGILEELYVVEGQEVERGQLIARLISLDAEIAMEQARAMVARCEGELQRAQAERIAVGLRRDNPLHLRVPLAEAQSALAKVTTERDSLPHLIKAAEAKMAFSLRSLEGKRNAGAGVPQVLVQQAERDYLTAEAELDELRARDPNLQREIDALQTKVQSLEAQLRLMIEEQRAVAEAEAKVVSALATLDDARLRLRQAELTLTRMSVVAPMDGRILRLVSSPGTRVMGLEHMAGQSSSTVVEMYDPEQLQVRADVRLEDVPLVTPGAPVEIKTASSEEPVWGHVLQPTSSANVQKNTLEVKVALIEPPPTLRPEMLVTATFLAPRSEAGPATDVTIDRLLVPRTLVKTGESGPIVWTVDADGCARSQVVTLGADTPNGLVEITAGLDVTAKLISSPPATLSVGRRVIITADDSQMGKEK